MSNPDNTHFTLVRIESGSLAGTCCWQATDGDGEDAKFLGLFDDDGEQIHLGNASWVAIRDDLTPPFAG